MMGWYNDGSLGTGGWITMILMMSLFWGAVIFAGVMLFRGTSNSRRSRESGRVDGATYRNPVDILDERFARGELENQEYDARKAVLLGTQR
jgi:putative membrane protein